MDLKQLHTMEIISDIENILDENSHIISSRLHGDVYKLNYWTGYAEGLLEQINKDDLPQDYKCFIAETKQKISVFKEESNKISNNSLCNGFGILSLCYGTSMGQPRYC